MASSKQPKNSESFVINAQYFQGGITVDYKMGIANSFYNSQNLDFRTFPSQMSVLPASREIASNLQDCVLALQQDIEGVVWGVGDKGYIYAIDTSNNVTNQGQLTEDGSAGLLYAEQTDTLYIPGQSKVSLFGPLNNSNTPKRLSLDLWGPSASSAYGCVALYNSTTGFYDGGAGYRNNIISDSLDTFSGITLTDYTTQVTNTLTNTYVLPTTIQETSTNYCPFSPDIEPFYSIAVYVDKIGTGNWTLTLHNSVNDELSSVEITHADMVTGWNNFVFSSQVRAFVNASNIGIATTYHFHLTSSVSGDTASVFTYNANDVSGCNFVLFADRLVSTNNNWHPTAYFTGTGFPLLCMGNGEYVATYNFGNDHNPSTSQFIRHMLTFTPGEEVCGISSNYGYLVIGTERRSKVSTRNLQLGRLYFWNGQTQSPSFYIDLPMGAPYGLYTFNNVTYFACSGSLYAWSGGQTVLKVRKLAYQNTDYMDTQDLTRVNPNGFTSRYNILMMGYPSSTTDPNIDYGIWSWGAVELTFPNSYGYSYSQSIVSFDSTTSTTTNQSYTSTNNLKLGCVVNYIDRMYSSWQYTDSSSVVHSGLDIIDNFSDPATYATWTSLIYDGGVVYKQKEAVRYKVYFEALPTGWELTPWWIVDRGQTNYGATATSGATEVVTEWNNLRFHELQWGFNLVNTGSATAPAVILGVSAEIKPLSDEADIIPGEV